MNIKHLTTLLCLCILCFTLNAQPATAKESNSNNNSELEALFPVLKNGKTGYININGDIVIPIKYDKDQSYNLYSFTGKFIILKEDGLHHVQDRNGKRILENNYKKILLDEDNKLFQVTVNKGKSMFENYYGLYHYSGAQAVPPIYKRGWVLSGAMSEGLWTFKQDDKIGYLNINNEVVIAPSFYMAGEFKNGYAKALKTKKGKWGIINKKGNWVIEPQYKQISNIDEKGYGTATEIDKEKYYIINVNGSKKALNKLRPKMKWMMGDDFYHGLCRVYDTITNKVGFIDYTGKAVIPIKFTLITLFNDAGYASANYDGAMKKTKYRKEMVNGRWTVINRKGEELFTPKKLESLGAPSDGMVRFKRNGLYGFLNLKGDVEIEEKYSETPLPFKNGLSRIYTKAVDAGSYLKVRPFGYINKAGKVVWAPQL